MYNTNPAVTNDSLRENAGKDVEGMRGKIRQDLEEQGSVGLDFGNCEDGDEDEDEDEDEEKEEEEEESAYLH